MELWHLRGEELMPQIHPILSWALGLISQYFGVNVNSPIYNYIHLLTSPRALPFHLKFKILSHLPQVRNQSLIIETIMCLNEVIKCKKIIQPVLYYVSTNIEYRFIMSEQRALINLLHSIYISTMSETQYLCACL